MTYSVPTLQLVGTAQALVLGMASDLDKWDNPECVVGGHSTACIDVLGLDD